MVNSTGLPRLTGSCCPLDGHQPDQSIDQLVHIAEGAGLLAGAVERQLLSPQRLHDEVGDHPPVVLRHAGPVGVEDPGDADIDPVLAVIVHHQRLGDALALVVAGAGADGVDIAPVALRLRMDGRDLRRPRRSRPGESGPEPLGQHQHVDGAQHVRLDGLDRVVLVVNGRGGAGQVVDLVDLEEERLGDVVPDKLELVVVEQMLDVLSPAGEEVVQADDVMAVRKKPLAEVGADEAGAAGDENAHGPWSVGERF